MKTTVVILLILSSLSLFSEWHPAKVESGAIYPNNQGMSFIGVDCADSLNCFAIANYSFNWRVIYQSKDAGRTWNIIFNDYQGDITKSKGLIFRAIAYPSVNKCLIAGDSSIILMTNDGGASWERINLNIPEIPKGPEYHKINYIKMYDSLHGIAATNYRLFYTKDGGYNWKMLDIPKPDAASYNSITDVAILAPGTFLFNHNAFDPYNFIYITSDIGKSWEAYEFNFGDPVLSYKNKFFFVDSVNGWIAGGVPTGIADIETKRITATKDGGKTWTVQYDESSFNPKFTLFDISFNDINNGISVGRFGGILKTSNGGVNWLPDTADIIRNAKPATINTSWRNIKNPIIVDVHGRIFYDDGFTSTIEAISKADDLLVYPNPANDIINMLISSDYKQGEVRLVNVEGKIIKSIKASGENSIDIDIKELPSGVYALLFINENAVHCKMISVIR